MADRRGSDIPRNVHENVYKLRTVKDENNCHERAAAVDKKGRKVGKLIGDLTNPPHPAEYLPINCEFAMNVQWKSYVALKAYWRQTAPKRPGGDIDHHCALIKFDRDCVKPQGLTLRRIERSDLFYRSNDMLNEFMQKRKLWELSIKYDSTKLNIGAIKSNVYAERKFEPLHQLDKYLEEREEAFFLIAAGDHVQIMFDRFIDLFANEVDKLSLWYPNHPNKCFIVMNDWAPADERPKVAITASNTFSSWAEYQTVMFFATLQESEHVQSMFDSVENVGADIRLIAIPGTNGCFIGLLSFDEEVNLPLKEYDTLKIQFNPDMQVSREEWSAVLIRPALFAPLGYRTVMVTSKWNPEAQTYHTVEGLRFIEPESISHNKEIEARVRNLEPNRIEVRFKFSRKCLKYQIIGLDNLNRKAAYENRAMLLVGRGATGESSNVYYRVDRSSERYVKKSNYTEDQQKGINMLGKLQDNVGIITGPPGTGKTKTVVGIVTLLLAPPVDGEPPYRVLITAPSNSPVDEAAERVYAETQKWNELKDRVVIRLYNLDTEKERMEYTAAPDRETDDDRALDTATIDQMTEFSYSYSLYKMYKNATDKPFGVRDRRFKMEELSLSGWMARKAGLTDDHYIADASKYSVFRNLFQRMQEGQLDSDGKEDFTKQFSALRDDTLRSADVVLTTMMHASTPALVRIFDPDLIIVDEAAKAPEPDFWYIMNYPTSAFLLVGDDAQLKPITHSTIKTNGFVKQLQLPYFARIKATGHPYITLTTQHRAVPILASLTSDVFYDGILTNGPGTAVEGRPDAQAMEDFLTEKFPGLPRTSAMIVSTEGQTLRDSSKSYYNMNNASAMITYLEEILEQERVPADHITMVTFYKAQVQLLGECVDNLHKARPELRANLVDVRTVDGMQGTENHVILLDVVITDRLGFLRQSNHLNVSTSRAKDAMIIFAATKAIRRIDERDSEWITRVFEHLKIRKMFRKVEVEASNYLPEKFTTHRVDGLRGWRRWRRKDGGGVTGQPIL